MLIIDSHTHVFNTIKGKNTSPLKYGKVKLLDKEIRLLPPLSINTTFSPEVLLEYMKLAEVDRAILLQAPFYGEMNQYIKKIVEKYPEKFAGSGYVDLWKKGAKRNFYYIADILKFKVIKIEFSSESGFSSLYPDIQINDKKLNWFWKECEKRSIVVILDLGPVATISYQTKNIKSIIYSNPELKIIICHLAQPPFGDDCDESKINLWKEQMLLAKNPNVYLDLAIRTTFIAFEDFPYPKAKNFIYETIENVGAGKIIFGSDMPGLLNHVTYSKYITFFKKYCDFIAKDDLEQIMGKTAYGLFFNKIS
ncbi:MAG: amidohydrolase family protein [Candidatus Humimicrobiaceae bacterium]